MDTSRTRTVAARGALVAACAGTLLGPLHALARFATHDGQGDLHSPVVRAWAEPAARSLRSLLDWGSPDTVYLTYGKGWFPILLVATACAFVVRGSRTPTGVERVGWWIALTGYCLATASVLGDYWTPWIDQSFLFLGIPGMFVSMIGSAVLGFALVRRGYRPRTTAWLLLTWPVTLFAIVAAVAQGAALIPMLWAWAPAGLALRTPSADAGLSPVVALENR